MDNLLNTVKHRIPCQIPVLKKFVDDLILALPKDQVQAVLDIFNNYNPHLQFTVEREIDSKLPFLDILLTRHEDQTISTSWYSKPIASGRLINFHSFHPTTMKINVATNYIERVRRLTTNQDWDHLKQTVFQNLRQNNYPATLINRILSHIHTNDNRRIESLPPTIASPPTASPPTASPPAIQQQPPNSSSSLQIQSMPPEPVMNPASEPKSSTNPSTEAQNTHTTHQKPLPAPIVYKSIPFFPQLTTNIAHSLKKDFPQVKLAYRTIKTTKNILKQVKDPVPKTQQSNVIYSIPCKDCENIYIGMTKNQLKTRLSGHQTHINKHEKLTEINTTEANEEIDRLKEITALMKHSIEQDHKFDLTKTTIIDQSRRTSALPILEMCHISNNTNTVNHRTDVDNLHTTYAGILHTIKNRHSRKYRQIDVNSNTQISDHG